uniref:LNR domain-containing protein n=1 Tax=Hanusia phi TaxID=3032 RepID=A0A7S0F111_9CRYP
MSTSEDCSSLVSNNISQCLLDTCLTNSTNLPSSTSSSSSTSSNTCYHPCMCQKCLSIASWSLQQEILANPMLRIDVIDQPFEGYNLMTFSSNFRVAVRNCLLQFCLNVSNVQVVAKAFQEDGTAITIGNHMDQISATTGEDGTATFDHVMVRISLCTITKVFFTFTIGGSDIQARSRLITILQQQNFPPNFINPTPVLCTDADSIPAFYLKVGSTFILTVSLEDKNTFPLNKLHLDINFTSDAHPPEVYITENMFSLNLDNPLILKELRVCDNSFAISSVPSLYHTNIVNRSLVWNSVSWFPKFLVSYRGYELATNSSLQSHEILHQTCTRTVEINVCDRPQFVEPSPLVSNERFLVLADALFDFTLAVTDRNHEDDVDIFLTSANSDYLTEVGPLLHELQQAVSGREVYNRHVARRRFRWRVPADGVERDFCFRARDNQSTCDEGGVGLWSENSVCLRCTTDKASLYSVCTSYIVTDQLDERVPLRVCGDSKMSGGETCDDGNSVGGDGCSSLCTVEAGFTANSDGHPRYICGDGMRVFGETCDDGNTVGGDGCNATCQEEFGYQCVNTFFSVCSTICGDNEIVGNETCETRDGCSSVCTIESGWYCPPACNETNPETARTYCRAGCELITVCGDRMVRGPEECDDGNTRSGDGCSSNCTREEHFVCSADLTTCSSICGDGIKTMMDECDDGNRLNGDGCSGECTIEVHFTCVERDRKSVCNETCGDGILLADQGHISPLDNLNQCDDGNRLDHDGCSSTCRVERDLGYKCESNPLAAGDSLSPRSVCSANCGDGIRTLQEECDDNNTRNMDGCDSVCKQEVGFTCTQGGLGSRANMTITPGSCLDVIAAGDRCCFSSSFHDFTCLQDGDVCLNRTTICLSGDCKLTAGNSERICNLIYADVLSPAEAFLQSANISMVDLAAGDQCKSVCGDGVRSSAEQCDDNNTISGDGCSDVCTVEVGWICIQADGGYKDECSPLCGDGVRVLGYEECDDGMWSDPVGDGCTSDCKLEPGFRCLCDDQDRLIGGRCEPVCGDGVRVQQEACDDGNTRDGDGCSSSCSVESGWVCSDNPQVADISTSLCYGICADGKRVAAEQCDDGNTKSGDGCDQFCGLESGYVCADNGLCSTNCGDGIIAGKEACDDMNNVDGDGCSAFCLIEAGFQCIPADCYATATGSACRVQEQGKGSYCEVCPPIRFTGAQCSNPPCNPVGLTQTCADWRFKQDGTWEQDKALSSSFITVPCRPDWYADGYCDAVNNNAECGFDSGDCCSSTCSCGVTTVCYQGDNGGCGKFRGRLGDFHCLDPSTPAVTLPTIVLRGKRSPSSTLMEFLSYVEVIFETSDPDIVIFYSLDGTTPAFETYSSLEVTGQTYTGPFNITQNVQVVATAYKWGSVLNQTQQSLYVQSVPPVITPLFTSQLFFASPLLVTISSSSPDAQIMYRVELSGQSATLTSQPFLVYQGPIRLVQSGNVTAYVTIPGSNPSQVVQASYNLQVSPPALTPAEGLYINAVSISLQSLTPDAQTYYTLCKVEEFPAPRSLAISKCVGGLTEGSACGGSSDNTTCGANATCVVTYQNVRECYPNEWPSRATLFTSNIILNSSIGWGTRTFLTAYSKYGTLADSNATVAFYRLQTESPALVTVPANSTFPNGAFTSPVQFNFSVSFDAIKVFYTLDGSNPYERGVLLPNGELVTVTQSVNVSWCAIAPNLENSTVSHRQIVIQEVYPALQVECNILAMGCTTDKALLDVTTGFQYPTVFSPGECPPNPNFLISSSSTSSAVYYRISSGAQGWPLISYSTGSTSAPIYSSSSWILYTGQSFSLSNNSTVEMFTARPGVSNSFIVSYPLFIRSRCPAGYISSDQYNPCTPCPQDTYQFCKGLVFSCRWDCECPQCSPGKGTVGDGVPTDKECYDFCPKGSYSKTGLSATGDSCVLCGYGEYQDKTRTTSCLACPSGTNTSYRGSTSISDCWGSFGLSTGGFHTCGITSAGWAECWGFEEFGQTSVIHDLLTIREFGVPLQVTQNITWNHIAAGSFFTCGIASNFSAFCWGQDYAGQTRVPTALGPESNATMRWTAISSSAGYHHSCGIVNELVLCWGDNSYNQSSPPAGRAWKQVSAGQFHSCGVTVDGEPLCWGDDLYGQSTIPPQAATASWRMISAGHYHSCGILSTGQALCWGSAIYGATAVPKDVSSWSNLAVGRFHTCGVSSSGALRCWGSNQDGALSFPQDVPSWRGVVSGLFHSCGIAVDYRAHCWGRSVYGMTNPPDYTWRST